MSGGAAATRGISWLNLWSSTVVYQDPSSFSRSRAWLPYASTFTGEPWGHFGTRSVNWDYVSNNPQKIWVFLFPRVRLSMQMVTGSFWEDLGKSFLFILVTVLHGPSSWGLKFFFKKWILENPFFKISKGLWLFISDSGWHQPSAHLSVWSLLIIY